MFSLRAGESERRDRTAARGTPRRCPKAHLIDERSDKLTPSADSCIQGEWCFATASVSQTNNRPSQRVNGACEHSVQHRDDVDRNCHVVPPSTTSMTTPLGSQRWQASSAGGSRNRNRQDGKVVHFSVAGTACPDKSTASTVFLVIKLACVRVSLGIFFPSAASTAR
jgi:hypothetical protein